VSDDIVVRLREVSPSEDAEQASYLLTDAADEILSYRGTVRALDEEIESLRKDLELAIQVKQFVSFWWDDPSKVGECCAAWDKLPEEVRMWVLE
jgi:hypothetical protein